MTNPKTTYLVFVFEDVVKQSVGFFVEYKNFAEVPTVGQLHSAKAFVFDVDPKEMNGMCQVYRDRTRLIEICVYEESPATAQEDMFVCLRVSFY